MSVHRGRPRPDGSFGIGEQLAAGPTMEFDLPGDSNNVTLAQEETLRRWQDAGRPVSAQWTDADNAQAYPNVEALD